ncbi:MAG TPA: hypothetical protein VHL31_04880 [Geminicoccus sp.]|jgi:hypothetical protein|uniref:hypothetical protein n=1 Tax=Geminicoccus sp. TaxID=2024832 RepID=UPI002E37A679|nr:hypothetical protein [Geminicoccus sp.]HEX2525621.1 hypothetical protein [Geminicoccus sp.]
MSWKDGWAEWSFERLRQTLLRQLANDLAASADSNTLAATAASDDIPASCRPDITDPSAD